MVRVKRTSTRVKRVFHWLLGSVKTPSYTVVITKKSGVDVDVSSEIIQDSLSVTCQSIRFGLDSCSFVLDNSKGKYRNTFSGGETIKISADYGSGTARVFKGKLNHPIFESSSSHRIRFFGRKANEFKGIKIKGSYSGKATTLVTDIIDANFSTVLSYSNFSSNLAGDDKEISIDYNDYGINVLSKIFGQMGWDGRLDHDSSDVGKFDLEGFTKGTKHNSDVAIVHGQNKLRVNRFGVDTDKIFNKVSVIGSSVGGGSIIRTKTDSASIASLWEKQLEVSDSRLSSMDAVDERASFELSDKTSTSPRGNITAVGSEKMKAAYTNEVSSQYDGIFGRYIIAKYTLFLGRNLLMNVDIEKPTRKISDLILDRINSEEGIKTFDNPNSMLQSVNLSFDDDTDLVLSDVVVEDGLLKLASGKTSGSVTTKIYVFDIALSSFDFVLESPVAFGSSKVEVSNDGGVSYVRGDVEKTVYSFAESLRQVVIKVTLDGSSAQLGGVRIGLK